MFASSLASEFENYERSAAGGRSTSLNRAESMKFTFRTWSEVRVKSDCVIWQLSRLPSTFLSANS